MIPLGILKFWISASYSTTCQQHMINQRFFFKRKFWVPLGEYPKFVPPRTYYIYIYIYIYIYELPIGHLGHLHDFFHHQLLAGTSCELPLSEPACVNGDVGGTGVMDDGEPAKLHIKV